MVSSFKEEFKNQTLKSSEQIYLFLSKFTSKISYQSIAFYKNKVMSFLRISFLSTAMELSQNIHEMFKPWLLSYNTESQMPLDIFLRKTNQRQVGLSFLGPEIWSRINPSNKNVKQRLLSCML